MTPDELAVVTRWMTEGLDDLYIGARWHDWQSKAGKPELHETWTETGKRLREEATKQQGERQ